MRLPCLLLALFAIGQTFATYGDYNRSLKSGGVDWLAVLHGHADAPEQYRIGVVRAADWLSRIHLAGHAGPRLSVSFAVFDLLGMLLALLLILHLLEESSVYRDALPVAQWFAVAALLALAFYELGWIGWYRRVNTLPACALTALWVWLWTPRPHTPLQRGRGRLSQAGRAAALLVAAAILSTFRADLALFLAAGVFFAGLLGWTGPLPLSRPVALGVSALAAAIAAGMQLYLMRVAYPHATYGITPVFMLRHDVYRPAQWTAFLVFTAPALWTFRQARRSPGRLRRPANALLLTAPAYLLLWVVVGRLDEVRIFLPLALALLPTTVDFALQSLPADTARTGAPS